MAGDKGVILSHFMATLSTCIASKGGVGGIVGG